MADEDGTRKIVTRKEAEQLGLDRFFTGRPCNKGHVSERILPSGNCTVCYKEYMISYSKKSYQENKEKIKERSDRRYKEKRDHVLAVQRANPNRKENNRKWRIENRDWVNILQKKWRDENIEHYRSQQNRWQKNNKEKVRNSIKKWELKNPEKVLAIRHKRRARKLSAEGNYTGDDIKRIYKMQKGKCPYCGEKLNGKYQVDHIMSLDKGGTNWPRNIQLLCHKKTDGCNQSKGNRDPIDWVRKKLGKLL